MLLKTYITIAIAIIILAHIIYLMVRINLLGFGALLFAFLLPIILAILALRSSPVRMANNKAQMQNSNVLKKPLGFFSKDPPTGFYRDGYCRVGPEDKGNHSVAGLLTDEFLDFTASRGNNLRDIGLKSGTKWCLCASRWKEAMQAAKDANDPVVPKVYMHATSDSALIDVSYDDLKKFAAPPENVTGAVRRGVQNPAPVIIPENGGDNVHGQVTSPKEQGSAGGT